MKSGKRKTGIKFIATVFVLIAFIGFLDSTYLAAKHYQGAPVICSVLEGCDKVTGSQYATIGSIPVALLGVVYYFGILFLALISLFSKDGEKYFNLLIFIAPIGFLASLWFVYLQIFVIKAICFYCMISAASSTLIFLMALFFLVYRRKIAAGIIDSNN